MTAEDYAAEAAYFAGPGPLLDDLSGVAEQVCEVLSDDESDVDVAFDLAREALEADTDFDAARSQIQAVRDTADQALALLGKLEGLHREAISEGVDATVIAAAIARGFRGEPTAASA
ncbi:hypothetical protein ACFVVM_32795 [Nocardia sp. NPDC058176]|uniref:hypothetical protein n=1 Tax=Nocardia sp. NPDC058176 TaxID=3346368 RepID=UPI0036D81314